MIERLAYHLAGMMFAIIVGVAFDVVLLAFTDAPDWAGLMLALIVTFVYMRTDKEEA